jgi:hypothetical protein
LAYFFGRQSALRATGETEQAQEQLKAERSQRAFDNNYFQEQIAMLLRDNMQLRYEIAKRDREAAFARASSPSTSVH